MADEQNWALPVLAGVVVLGLAAAHGIDTSQWSPRFRPTAAGSSRTSATAATRATTRALPAGTPAPMQVAPPAGSPARRPTPAAATTPRAPLGVQPGAAAGAVAAKVSTVIVQTAVDTCWSMVVDGSAMTGCGPAAVTDTRGAPAAMVTRTRGTTPIRVEIVRAGSSVATGTVGGSGHPLTLTAR